MDSAHELAVAAAVAAVEASAVGGLPATTAAAPPPVVAPVPPIPPVPPATVYSTEAISFSTEVGGIGDLYAATPDAVTCASATPVVTTVPAVSTFTAAAAAAAACHGIAISSKASGSTKAASAPKRKRLLRLEGGDLVVIPTNIYKQAGGVKLDITLGGFRIDNEKCTLKNRAYNFGVLPGFTRENILALRCVISTSIPQQVGEEKVVRVLHAKRPQPPFPPPRGGGRGSRPIHAELPSSFACMCLDSSSRRVCFLAKYRSR